jgi:hypothetical protein
MRCQSWSNDRQGQATRLALSMLFLSVRRNDSSSVLLPYSGRPQEAQNLAPGFTGAPQPGQNFGVFVGAAFAEIVFSGDTGREGTACFGFTKAPAAPACRSTTVPDNRTSPIFWAYCSSDRGW